MGTGELPPSHARDLVPTRPAGLPVPQGAVKRLPGRRLWLRVAVLLAVLAGGAGGYYYWWQHLRSALPAGIVYGNGRLEADEINIDTKYAGRIAEMLADEGDLVKAGQVVARMDTQDLAASLKKARSAGQSGTPRSRRGKRQCNAAENAGPPGAAAIRPRRHPGAKRLSDQGGSGSAAATAGRRQRGA